MTECNENIESVQNKRANSLRLRWRVQKKRWGRLWLVVELEFTWVICSNLDNDQGRQRKDRSFWNVGSADNGKDQLGRRSSNVEILWVVEENRSILNTNSDGLDTFWGMNLLRDTVGGRVLGKATRGRKRLQRLSDVTSKTYEGLKREAGISSAAYTSVSSSWRQK